MPLRRVSLKERLYAFCESYKRNFQSRLLERGYPRELVDKTLAEVRLTWIARLLQNIKTNWKSVSEHFFRKCGGLHFLLRCNYHKKYLVGLLTFCKDALSFFCELKSLNIIIIIV